MFSFSVVVGENAMSGEYEADPKTSKSVGRGG